MEKKDKKKSSFFVRRLHSLLGLVPIGIFLCVHFLLNSGAFAGVQNYIDTVAMMRGVPFIVIAELVIIAIPIIFHALYGIYIVYLSGVNVLHYKYLNNWYYLLQRITAIVTTLFVLFHVLTIRVLTQGTLDVVATMVAYLQSPLFFTLYCIGVVSAVFHFCHGLFTFLITWGIIQGPRVQKIFSGITMAIFVLMSVWGVAILFAISRYQLISLF